MKFNIFKNWQPRSRNLRILWEIPVNQPKQYTNQSHFLQPQIWPTNQSSISKSGQMNENYGITKYGKM